MLPRLPRLGSAHEQYRDRAPMPKRLRHAAVQQIREETMAVRGHGDEVAALALCRRRDLAHRIAAREYRVRLEAVALEPGGDSLEIRSVALNLLALAERELMDVSRRPAIGHVDENYRGPAEARERANVLENRLIVRGVLEGNENSLVHDHCPPVRSCAISHTFSAAIKNATK